MKKLIIVESPTKAKTISKFLDKTYIVKSSFGHIRDLPKNKIGIDVDNNFEMEYKIPDKSKKIIAELKKALKQSDEVILASDEDREGEAIAWHLLESLKVKEQDSKRIVFHEITKEAIKEALKNPRDIDINLVNAQQARRALDRLVGYELSPFLWKKVRVGLSAGRVQSVALRLITEREEEINKFDKQEYWTIEADLQKKEDKEKNIFQANLISVNGKKLKKFDIKDKEEATKMVKDIENKPFIVTKITQKETQKKPLPPFITSTLQRTAVNKLGFSSKQTMMIAQQLYEGINLGTQGQTGLITYMRTDSTNLSSQALTKARDYIKNKLGPQYLPKTILKYTKKAKGAQEAHEAIRPTFPEITPQEIEQYLDAKQFKLYNLIWTRFIACQMESAIIAQTSIEFDANKNLFRSNGSIIKFEGFLKIYKTQTKENLLPELKEKEEVNVIKINPNQHFTEPPARYSEASLIKSLEEHGIGRPSTYAPTISTIQNRKYVEKNESKKFFPTETGILVNKVLVEHFPKIVDIKFTAEMEEELDDVAHGEKKWQKVLKDFYVPFKKNLIIKDKEVTRKDLTEEKTNIKCDKCNADMIIKFGRFGKFFACSAYPECKNTKQLNNKTKTPGPALEDEETNEKCDKCGSKMIYKIGRYGKFLACSAYPECKNIKSIKKSTDINCPKCKKGEILEKKSKRGKIFYACSEYPKCDFALWSKPLNEFCPECKSILVYGAKNTAKCSNKECAYKKDLD